MSCHSAPRSGRLWFALANRSHRRPSRAQCLGGSFRESGSTDGLTDSNRKRFGVATDCKVSPRSIYARNLRPQRTMSSFCRSRHLHIVHECKRNTIRHGSTNRGDARGRRDSHACRLTAGERGAQAGGRVIDGVRDFRSEGSRPCRTSGECRSPQHRPDEQVLEAGRPRSSTAGSQGVRASPVGHGANDVARYYALSLRGARWHFESNGAD
jgi:hypothetical protein